MTRRGFGVTDLLIALMLVGVMVAVAVPRIASAYQRASLRNAIEDFAATHSKARALAVQRGQIVELHVDAGATRYWLELESQNDWGRVFRDTLALTQVDGTRIAMESDRSLLCFDGRGLPTTRGSCEPGDAQLTFRSNSKARSLSITSTGRILR